MCELTLNIKTPILFKDLGCEVNKLFEKSEIDSDEGVYFLTVTNKTGEEIVYYIGQSICLRERLKEHYKKITEYDDYVIFAYDSIKDSIDI